MSLSHSQRKYIKKHLHQLSTFEIAQVLGVSESEILQYTKEKQTYSINHWFSDYKWYFLVLSLIIILIYSNTLDNVFISDDISYLVDNPLIKSINFIFDNPMAIIRNLLYWSLYNIFGLTPAPYHLMNILFHIGNTWLIFLILSKIIHKKIAFITSCIFAVHPLLTESVTWISGGIYAQYSFFFLCALWLYIQSSENLILYFLSLVSYFISFFIQGDKGFILCLLIPLYEFTFGNIKKNWKRTIPYLGLGLFEIIYLVGITGYVSHKVTKLASDYYVGSGYYNPFFQIPIAISSYIFLLFWPDKLSFYQSEMIFSFPEYVLRIGITLGLFSILLMSFKKSKFIFFWLSFFLISLLPTLSPLKIGWVVAERYVYIGSVGVIASIMYVANWLFQHKFLKPFQYIVYAILILGLSTRTIIRNNDWNTADSLWIATGRTAPSDPKTHNNLGDMYSRHKEYKKAIAEFSLAIQLLPYYADAYHNRGNALYLDGQVEEAISSYKNAIKYNPRLWQTYRTLGVLFTMQKKYDLAGEYFQKAIAINPDDALLLSQLGQYYIVRGNHIQGKKYLEKSLSIDPTNPETIQALEKIK